MRHADHFFRGVLPGVCVCVCVCVCVRSRNLKKNSPDLSLAVVPQKKKDPILFLKSRLLSSEIRECCKFVRR